MSFAGGCNTKFYQVQSAPIKGQTHLGYAATARSMYHDQGFFVFYKGLVATYAKIMPATALAFAINEKLKRFRNLN